MCECLESIRFFVCLLFCLLLGLFRIVHLLVRFSLSILFVGLSVVLLSFALVDMQRMCGCIPVEAGTYSRGKAGGQPLLDTRLDSPDHINDDEPWKCHTNGIIPAKVALQQSS